MHAKTASLAERGLAAAGAFGAIAGLVWIKFVNPASTSFLPACPLHALTGLNCPGCGATRGMHRLLNGDVSGALDYNALLVVFVPLMIYGFVWLLLLAARGRGLPFPKFFSKIGIGLLAVMLAFAVLRNLPFYPFTILAP